MATYVLPHRCADITTCGYCGAVCRLTSPTRGGGGDPEPSTWWLYFDRPSRARQRALQKERGRTIHKEQIRAEEEAAKQEAATPLANPVVFGVAILVVAILSVLATVML